MVAKRSQGADGVAVVGAEQCAGAAILGQREEPPGARLGRGRVTLTVRGEFRVGGNPGTFQSVEVAGTPLARRVQVFGVREAGDAPVSVGDEVLDSGARPVAVVAQ